MHDMSALFAPLSLPPALPSTLPPLVGHSVNFEKSRALSEFEDLRWQVGGSPEDNDGMVRDKLVQQCRLSKAIVIKETRLPEVRPFKLLLHGGMLDLTRV